jgi:hypothetical protein
MKNYILLTSIICLLLGCSIKKSNKIKFECNPSFDFDEVEYVRTNSADSVLSLIWDKPDESISKNDQLTLDILSGEEPGTVENLKILNSLGQMGFERVMFEDFKYDNLRTFFCRKEKSLVQAKFCIPVYRDILIFKKNEKIVGFAKICFDCDQAYVGGTGNNFGRYFIDFELMKKINTS